MTMARSRRVSDLSRNRAKASISTLGAATSGSILGVSTQKMRDIARGKGTLTPSQARRLGVIADPNMQDYLSRLKERALEKRSWTDKAGRKHRRTNKQINEALSDAVDESKPGKLKRDAKTQRLGQVMDRLGVPLAGNQAEYLKRKRKRRAA